MEGWREEVGVGPTVSRVGPIAPQVRKTKIKFHIMINLDGMQYHVNTQCSRHKFRNKFSTHSVSAPNFFLLIACIARGKDLDQGNSCEVIKNSSLFFVETFKVNHTTNSVMLHFVCLEIHGVQSTSRDKFDRPS